MVEVSIPQDIREFEPTLIGYLTTRQFLCGAAAVALVYGTYMIEKACGVSDPLSLPLFLIPGVIPVLIGWMKPFGQKFEVFIVQTIQDNILAPANRPYVVENLWDVISEEEKQAQIAEMTQEEKKAYQNEKAKKNKKEQKAKRAGKIKAYR